MKKHAATRFVVIGGGTGSFTVLSGLKQYASDITALVSMADDGGSTGILRDELGVLPPGDVRQCLVALSDPDISKTLRDLFNFRFEEGSLAGHSFGNLFLSAIEKMTNDFNEAVRLSGELLHITGRVMPITLDNVRLAIRWGEEIVRGEGTIDAMDFAIRQDQTAQPELFLEPAAQINPDAVQAITEADVIVFAPGDLYTSLGPLLAVGGVAEALKATPARKVYISNLVVNPRQTKGFTVADHAAEIERFAGGPILDYVLYNTGDPGADLMKKYMREGEDLVASHKAQFKDVHYTAVGRDLLRAHAEKARAGDKLAAHRSLIRHDPDALARALIHIAAT
jgi:uncharacterized cofD-like protein